MESTKFPRPPHRARRESARLDFYAHYGTNCPQKRHISTYLELFTARFTPCFDGRHAVGDSGVCAL